MTNSFYTSVYQYGNRMLVRGYEDGKAFSRKVEFKPTLFIDSAKTNQTTEWKTLSGKPVYPIQPGSIKDCKNFLEEYKDVHGFGVHGLNQYEYQFISDTYTDEIFPDTSSIRICTLDIETKTEMGFPNIQTANEEILLISMMDYRTKRIVTFGCNEFKTTRKDIRYVKCASEKQMLQQFIKFWQFNCPEVITGWNVNGFDIPYLIRRCRYLDIDCENLSPWGIIRDEKTYYNGEATEIFSLAGIAILDYLELYKKFTFTPRETYRLDHIAEVELGENKLENPYESFKEFYTNDPQLFTEYNIHDVYLVDKLEDRLKLITLVFTLAYKAKVNFIDVFSPVRTWDILIYNYLRNKKVVVPTKTHSQSAPFVGGYVKDPIAGLHKWVASFDLTSLYPSIIMGYNMSPETIVPISEFDEIESLVDDEIKRRNI